MTERWRKKLDDIDKVGPTDDVYRRAKETPADPSEPLPRPRTANRIVTGVVAFSVFALALSAFAIPLLRMGSTTPSDEGSLGMFPIWPVQTTSKLQQLQETPPAWSLDPMATATMFAKSVMGWSDAEARSVGEPGCVFDLGVSPTPVPGNQGGCTSPTAQPDGLLTYAVSRPPARCTDTGTQTNASPVCATRPPELVEVYQPLEQGSGQIWAVHQALSTFPRLTLSVVAGQHVRDGATIEASISSPVDLFPAMGYGACGQRDASSGSGDITDPNASAYRYGTDVHLRPDEACQGDQPGYVWASAATDPIVQDFDPLYRGADDALVLEALTAVPVVAVFPPAPSGGETLADPTATPSSDQAGWTPYTDALGWTVDVPNGWTTQIWPDAGAGFSGDGITVEITRGGGSLVRDDSSFPLDPKGFLFRGEGALIGTFYGDGLPFGFIVMGDETNPPDLMPDQRAIVDHMIESISMEPWRLGETRNGLTAIAKILPYATADWIVFDGKYYISYYGGDGRRVVLGPAPACRGGADGTYEVRETGDAGVSCKDGEHGDWDFATGKPANSNTPLFAVSLPSTAAALAWDEHLLVRSSAKSTPSPTPS